MKRILVGAVLFVSLILAGCSFWPTRKIIEPAPVLSVSSGEILQKKRLTQGGNVLIVPFSAGENVAETNDLERTSLKIVRGIADVLKEGAPALKILTADNAADADFILKGYVTKRESSSRLKKIIGKGNIRVLAVEGKLVDRKTDEVVLYFFHERKAKGKTFDEMAQTLGEDIGRFILSGF
jgi:hypothetical protein